MSGVESLKDVALRPWPANKKDELSKDALLQQIEQLTTERGHLRDITEQSLQAEIEAGNNVPDDTKEGSEEDDDDKEAPSRKEKLEEIFRMQVEMAQHLEYAYLSTNGDLH